MTFAGTSADGQDAPNLVIELRFGRWFNDAKRSSSAIWRFRCRVGTFSHWRNLNFDVLPCRLILQHRGTGQKAAAENNARDDCRDNIDSAHALTSVPALARS